VGNSAFDRKRLNLKKLPYPLASYAPATALLFDIDKPVLLSRKNQLKIGFEIAFKVNDDLFMIDEEKVRECIREYYLCMSFYDESHLKKIRQPTERDVGVCEYYARWNDGSNLMFKLHSITASDVKNPKIDVLFGSKTYCFENHYQHQMEEITSFLASFTKIYKQTFITMGLIGQIDLSDSNSTKLTATIKSEKHTITIC
jgi:hypothetical protein